MHEVCPVGEKFVKDSDEVEPRALTDDDDRQIGLVVSPHGAKCYGAVGGASTSPPPRRSLIARRRRSGGGGCRSRRRRDDAWEKPLFPCQHEKLAGRERRPAPAPDSAGGLVHVKGIGSPSPSPVASHPIKDVYCGGVEFVAGGQCLDGPPTLSSKGTLRLTSLSDCSLGIRPWLRHRIG